MTEVELLTMFQEVAIVDEVTMNKDKASWICRPRSGLVTLKLLPWLVLAWYLGTKVWYLGI
uniref:Uncharacterized protein n=1 Tax=Oryza punctata TaxID=4537 RepID=A0A0E0K9G0_ORYPU